MAKRSMEFDFSVFGCNAAQAKAAFEAAGYEITDPEKEVVRVVVRPGDRVWSGGHEIRIVLPESALKRHGIDLSKDHVPLVDPADGVVYKGCLDCYWTAGYKRVTHFEDD